MIFKIIYNSLLCHWFRFFYYIESVSLITILIFFSTWFFNCLRARGAFYCRPWNKLCRGGNCRVSFIWTTIHHPPTLMSNFLLIIASRDTTFKIFQEHTAKTKFPIYWKRKVYIITITNKTKNVVGHQNSYFLCQRFLWWERLLLGVCLPWKYLKQHI